MTSTAPARRRPVAALIERTSIRTVLAALLILPIVLCTVLLGAAINARASSVSEQHRTTNAIADARSLQTVASALEAESTPTLAAFILQPGAPQRAQLAPLLAANGVGPAQLAQTRAATDRALAALPRALATTGQIHGLRTSLARLRVAADAGQEQPAATLSAFLGLNNTLEVLEQARLGSALLGGTSRGTVSALQQMTASARLLYTADELSQLAAAYRFRAVTTDPQEMQQLRSEFIQVWGAYTGQAQDFDLQATGRTLVLWRQSESSADARRVAAAYSARVLAPVASGQLTLAAITDELSLRRAMNVHETALADVSASATASAQLTINNLRHTATVQLWVLSAGVLITLLFLVGLLVVVTRAITRPMLRLAEQAHQISQGVLVDIRSTGPREIGIVGRALQACVNSLRRLQAQTEAVARGDLEHPTLEQPLPGRLGEVMHSSVEAVVTTFRERDVLQEQLAHQATHDALTGLPNRAETYRQVEAALQRTRRTATSVGVLFLDLDRFKAVNDTYGHTAGDQVLEVVAARLGALVRAGDSVGRLGGDEFVVISETVRRPADLRDLAARIIAAIGTPIPLRIEADEVAAIVGVSIGIATDHDGFTSAADLISSADAALYRAKAWRLGGAVFADEADPLPEARAADKRVPAVRAGRG